MCAALLLLCLCETALVYWYWVATKCNANDTVATAVFIARVRVRANTFYANIEHWPSPVLRKYCNKFRNSSFAFPSERGSTRTRTNSRREPLNAPTHIFDLHEKWKKEKNTKKRVTTDRTFSSYASHSSIVAVGTANDVDIHYNSSFLFY